MEVLWRHPGCLEKLPLGNIVPPPIGTVFYDALSSFEGGVNQGASPLILPPHTMAESLDVTVRGDFATHRPPYQIRTFSDAGGLMASAFSQGTFQAAAYYKPDSGFESLMASIAGRLFQFQIAGNTVTLSEQTLGQPQLSTASQAWMWQSEKWLIWQDGVSNPDFWDGSEMTPAMTRSDYNTIVPGQFGTTLVTPFVTPGPGASPVGTFSTTTTAVFLTPGVGNSVTVPFTSVTNLNVGDFVNIGTVAPYTMIFVVTGIVGLSVTMQQTEGFSNIGWPSGTTVTWNLSLFFADVTDLSLGDTVTIDTFGTYIVTQVQSGSNATNIVQLTGPTGSSVPSGASITWGKLGQQLRPGKMGTYGMGRNVYALGARSVASGGGMFNTTTASDFIVPSMGSETGVIALASVANLVIGNTVTITAIGDFTIETIYQNGVNLINVTAVPTTSVVGGTVVSWTNPPTPFIPAGQDFLFGDIVFGPSGTKAEDFRDSVLYETENDFINGGGLFTVPSNSGEIRAMRFLANLDQSLGQGPLQVFTVSTAFSCNVPVDRLTWQNLTNPILTESLISNGAQAQDSVQLVNGDAVFRSIDGIRSLILGRRDFTSWGNVPASFEVRDILAADDPALLVYGSSTVFDNRYLITTTPQSTDQGVTHTGLIALNLDPISSLRGKAQSVYDGAWDGLNIFKIITGQFQGVERCFAFCWDDVLSALNLVELLPTVTTQTKDNGTDDIVWEFTTASLKFGQDDPRQRELLQLDNGEIYVDELTGIVRVKVFYKPDQYPVWVPWSDFTETNTGGSPGFRPRIGLGQPSPTPCDVGNNRPLRQGFTYQFKFIITGDCVFLGGRFKAVSVAQSEFAKISACQT